MLIRRALVVASLVGVSVVGAESPAPAAGPPRLVPRCYEKDLSVSTYGDFEQQATKWMGTCVAANREHKLVEGNPSLKAVWNDVKHLAGTGKSVHVTTDFGFMDLGAGNFGVKSVTFATTVKPPPPQPTPTASTPSTPKPLPPNLLPDEKLPANLDGELRMALVRVRAAIDEDGGRVLPKGQADRLRCQLTKLADPAADDRQISWMGACGTVINAMSASQCSDSISARVKDRVKTKADLDRQELWFVHHLRPEIVNAARRLYGGASNADVMRFLRDIDADKFAAVHGLERMRERTQGFHGVDQYVVINDWIADAQRDARDINSCR